MFSLRTHGIVRNDFQMKNETDGSWYYEQQSLGFNFRMTDLQAALGISQMKRLDDFIFQRNLIAKKYNDKLKNLPLSIPCILENCYSSFHLYVIRLKTKEIKNSHQDVFEKLRTLNIGVNLHYMPVYNHPYYQRLGFNYNYCNEASSYYAEAISLPIYPDLSENLQDSVVSALYESIFK